MGLLVVAAVVALALTLLVLVTVALVQLVLFVTVRNTLLAAAVVGVYWFVDSRRRQVAKGFYSCADDVAGEQRHSIASNASEAESCADEVPVAAATTSPTSSGNPRTATSPMRLPELRHRKWKHPTRSVPLAPAKGESLLQENRKTASARGSHVRSASNSPRRPERYGSPRSVATEQKLMKSALESDGYWIGDFRVPAPALAKRSTSTGVSTPTKTTTKMTSAASFSTGSTTSTSSVTTSTVTAPTTTTRAYRRSNSHRV